jgi:pectin methylesterase-like acyl-CoA thioesterase
MIALRVTADRVVLSHERLLGAQDTLYAAAWSRARFLAGKDGWRP